jgi:hypothetical protein
MHDLAVRQTFLEVFGMTRRPTHLFGPGIALKALAGALVGRKKTSNKTTRGLPALEAA